MRNMNRTALAALINETLEVNGWNDRTLEKQAAEAGHKVTKSDVSLFRNHGMKQLVPAKIIGLAAGLKIPAYRVALAVLTDAGIEIPTDVRRPEDAIHHDHTLPAHTRETLLILIERAREGG